MCTLFDHVLPRTSLNPRLARGGRLCSFVHKTAGLKCEVAQGFLQITRSKYLVVLNPGLDLVVSNLCD
jgi:hypothetical protein